MSDMQKLMEKYEEETKKLVEKVKHKGEMWTKVKDEEAERRFYRMKKGEKKKMEKLEFDVN